MIKKGIAFIEAFVTGIPKPNKLNPDPYDYKYEEGSHDVAENVKMGLEGLEELYSIYEYNPYAKGSDKWEEIAVTVSPESARDLAFALFKDHSGQIDLRFEGKDRKVYKLSIRGARYIAEEL